MSMNFLHTISELTKAVAELTRRIEALEAAKPVPKPRGRPRKNANG